MSFTVPTPWPTTSTRLSITSTAGHGRDVAKRGVAVLALGAPARDPAEVAVAVGGDGANPLNHAAFRDHDQPRRGHQLKGRGTTDRTAWRVMTTSGRSDPARRHRRFRQCRTAMSVLRRRFGVGRAHGSSPFLLMTGNSALHHVLYGLVFICDASSTVLAMRGRHWVRLGFGVGWRRSSWRPRLWQSALWAVSFRLQPRWALVTLHPVAPRLRSMEFGAAANRVLTRPRWAAWSRRSRRTCSPIWPAR
jgi:hypothetical protein